MMHVRQHCEAKRANFVSHVAISRDTIGTHEDCIDLTTMHEVTSHVICYQR